MTSRQHRGTLCVGTGFVVLDVIRNVVNGDCMMDSRRAGGTCGNVLAILSYLGMRSVAVGRIGQDLAGRELVADLQESKVNVNFLVAEQGRRTPIVIQETFVDSRGRARHRFSRACPSCGRTMAPYRPLLAADVAQVASVLPRHGCFFFDRVTPGTLELARYSREQGALVVFEPSGVNDEKRFIECLRVSHVFKYSQDRLTNLDALVAQARPPLEIQTLGSDGLRFRHVRKGRLSSWRHLEALPIPWLRDSAGSGDWCTAGFITKILIDSASISNALQDQAALAGALRFGQALAALNCAYIGARGLMRAMSRSRALKAVTQLLANQIPHLPEYSDPDVSDLEPYHQACVVCTSESPAIQH